MYNSVAFMIGISRRGCINGGPGGDLDFWILIDVKHCPLLRIPALQGRNTPAPDVRPGTEERLIPKPYMGATRHAYRKNCSRSWQRNHLLVYAIKMRQEDCII